LAWDHEFDGKVKATAYGRNLETPKLEGSTGVAELGISVTTGDSGFALDLGVQGYAGRREGVSGSLLLKYDF
jgi:hypothetical protein